MANMNYKRRVATIMKLKGELDVSNMAIEIDEVTKSLATLLQDFDGEFVELTVNMVEAEQLPEPTNE